MNQADAAGLAQLRFVLKRFAPLAIPSGVLSAIDGRLPVGRLRTGQAGPELQHAPLVQFAGRPNEAVEFNAEGPPLIPEQLGDRIGILLRRHPGGLGGALDVLAVLVGAGEQEGVVALHLLIAPDRVGHHRAVGVPEMRRRIDVIKRSGQVKFRHDVLRRQPVIPPSVY